MPALGYGSATHRKSNHGTRPRREWANWNGVCCRTEFTVGRKRVDHRQTHDVKNSRTPHRTLASTLRRFVAATAPTCRTTFLLWLPRLPPTHAISLARYRRTAAGNGRGAYQCQGRQAASITAPLGRVRFGRVVRIASLRPPRPDLAEAEYLCDTVRLLMNQAETPALGSGVIRRAE